MTACSAHNIPLYGGPSLDLPLGLTGIDVVLEDPGSDTVNGVVIPIAPGGFYARSLESQSHALLHTFTTTAASGARGRDVVLESVGAGFAPGDSNSTVVARLPQIPAIKWNGPGFNGANLVLIGCRVRGADARAPETAGLVEIGSIASDAHVLDLGVADAANVGALFDATGSGRRRVGPSDAPGWLLRVRATR